MPTAQEWFDKWSKTYDEYLPHFPVYKRIVDIVLENANILSGAKVLDVGIGTGNVSLSIFNKIPCKITGVDISEKIMRLAKVKAMEMGAELKFINASADKMELNDTFDFAVAVLSLHHLKENGKLETFKRIHNSLKKGGRFILADLTVTVEGDVRSEEWLKHVLTRWGYEVECALKYIGPEAVDMALNGLRNVYYMDGEYPETTEKWKYLLTTAGFKLIKHEKPDERKGWQVFICDKM